MSNNAAFWDQFICFELRVSSDDEQDAMRSALQENSRNSVLSAHPRESLSGDFASSLEIASVLPPLETLQPTALVPNIRKYWAAGRTLKIRFLGGDEEIRVKVKKIASIWLQYANIKFLWLEKSSVEDPNIRIAFIYGGRSLGHML